MVAVHTLAAGRPIAAEDVRIEVVPDSEAPRGHTFAAVEDVLGRTPTSSILDGEVVRQERLAAPDLDRGIDTVVTPGKLGFALTLTQEEGYSPLVLPGDYVDVVWAPDPVRTRDATSDGARSLVQQARVLAVDHAWGGGPESTRSTPAWGGTTSYTLELSPEELGALLTGRGSGRIQVDLRSPLDVLQYPTKEPGTVGALRAGPTPP